MKYKIKPYERYKWHTWFAWHPVEVDGTFVWLERVQRRFFSFYDDDYACYKFIEVSDEQ